MGRRTVAARLERRIASSEGLGSYFMDRRLSCWGKLKPVRPGLQDTAHGLQDYANSKGILAVPVAPATARFLQVTTTSCVTCGASG